jgi:rSAM/selenodomain-associated transferase 1
MTKAPRAGEVKTRLTPPLTPKEAAELNTCFLHDTAAAIACIAREGKTRGVAVYTPVGAEKDYEQILPADFALFPQRGDALGERLIFATEDLFSLGFKSVCLINSDSPTVPRQVFSEAAQLLSKNEDSVVLGPSEDGGYFLIGFNKSQPALFENIPWSTGRVLEQTRARAEERGLRVQLLPPWYDVDDEKSLRHLCEELFVRNAKPAAGYAAPATRAYLEGLLKREGRERIWPDEEL